MKWGASMCAINYPHFVFPLRNSQATLLLGNIAVNWSNLLLLDCNEYWLHTVSRHHMSLSLSTVYLTSISKIAACFCSGLDCDNVWLEKCNGIFFRHTVSVLFQRHELLQLSHPTTKTTNTKKGLKQMHHAFSALTFFLSQGKYFSSLRQSSWKRDLYSGIKNYDLF